MKPCTNFTSEKQVIVVLCYRRTAHLEQVISALESAYLIETFTVLFVVQDPIDEVTEIINHSNLINRLVIEVDGSEYESSARAINSNLAIGLNHAFGSLNADLVVVLEDDIVISHDALCFFREATRIHLGNKRFRGVNGFSKESSLGNSQNGFICLNYGLGWGWAIPRRTYLRVKRYWTGLENDHWDFIFEPYIRTGFVVNPVRSRILNIGFDESATHTSGDRPLGLAIQKSFEVEVNSHECRIESASFDFTWRPDAVNVNKTSSASSTCIYFVRSILFLLYLLDTAPKPIYHAIRNRLLTLQIYLLRQKM